MNSTLVTLLKSTQMQTQTNVRGYQVQGISLVGEPGSGKTSIAIALAAKLNWTKISFAGPLKDQAAYALDTADGHFGERYKRPSYREEMDDPEKKDRYRLLLQWWGTEFRRADNPDYWVHQLVSDLSPNQGYVIDDCRFNNEHDALELLGFKTVLLEPGETTRPVQVHASEVDWHTWPKDLILTYERGPEHQAERIIRELSEGGMPFNSK